MAGYDFNRPTSFAEVQPFDKVGTGIPEPVLKKFFFQRAWNTSGLYFETWVSIGFPNPIPPSGDPIIGLTTSAFWKEVV